jgi:hypothetical protein
MIGSNKLAQFLGRPAGIKHAKPLRGQIADAQHKPISRMALMLKR